MQETLMQEDVAQDDIMREDVAQDDVIREDALLEAIELENLMREILMQEPVEREIQEIIIDEEFRSLLPELNKETYTWLEDSILQYGCREPLVLWGSTLIDGYNRYEIARRHDIPFNTVTMDFKGRDEAIIWIISTQIARRNLNPLQLSFYRGLHYISDKRVQGTGNQYSDESENRQNDGFTRATAKRLSEQYKVSPRTIERDAKTAEAIAAIGRESPEAKKKILACSADISRTQLRELLSKSESEIRDVAASIEGGTYAGRNNNAKKQNGEDGQTDPVSDMLLPIEREFNSITRGFSSELRNLYGSIDLEELRLSARLAIRNCVAMLEDLYGRV